MQTFTRGIDTLIDKTGFYSAYLVIPLVGVVVFEVFMRYVLDSPTSWAFEMTTFIYGVHFMLGLADGYRADSHVCIDVFESKMQPRKRAILRIITNLFMFLPTIGMLTIWSIKYAVTSWSLWEHASSSWAPAIYPYKTLMAIGFLLFFLSGVSKLLHDIHYLRTSN